MSNISMISDFAEGFLIGILIGLAVLAGQAVVAGPPWRRFTLHTDLDDEGCRGATWGPRNPALDLDLDREEGR